MARPSGARTTEHNRPCRMSPASAAAIVIAFATAIASTGAVAAGDDDGGPVPHLSEEAVAMSPTTVAPTSTPPVAPATTATTVAADPVADVHTGELPPVVDVDTVELPLVAGGAVAAAPAATPPSADPPVGAVIASGPIDTTSTTTPDASQAAAAAHEPPSEGALAAAAPAIAISDASVVEGTGFVDPSTGQFVPSQRRIQFSLTWGGVALESPIFLTASFQHGTTNAGDFAPAAPASMNMTISAGAAGGTVTFSVSGDRDDEVDETFTLTITASSLSAATIADGTAVGTILDDDGPALSVQGQPRWEGDGGDVNLEFIVQRSTTAVQDITFDIATSDGTATAGDDYVAAATRVTYPASARGPLRINVTVVGDRIDEPDETVRLTLSNAVGATIETGTAIGTIVDDDAVVRVSSAQVIERNDTGFSLGFDVTLSKSRPDDVTFDVATSDATATAGVDYQTVSSRVTIPAFQTRRTVWVKVLADTVDEPDETVTLTLTNVVGAAPATISAIGTIVDDDDPIVPVLSIGHITVVEGDADTIALVPVSLSEPTTIPVRVDLRTVAGTATAGGDFAARAASVTIVPGDTSATFDVVVFGDDDVETNETFSVEVVGMSGAAPGVGLADVTIANDDTVGSLAQTELVAREGEDGTTDVPTAGPGSSGITSAAPSSSAEGVDPRGLSPELRAASRPSARRFEATVPAGDRLPDTGSDATFPLLLVATGLVAAGLLLVRRRPIRRP